MNFFFFRVFKPHLTNRNTSCIDTNGFLEMFSVKKNNGFFEFLVISDLIEFIFPRIDNSLKELAVRIFFNFL